jgi:Holliday junction resolvase-like predicted endonuclease
MADAKKPAGKKPAAPSPASSEAEYVFFAVIGVIILFIIIPSVLKYFGFGDVKYSVPENLEGKTRKDIGNIGEDAATAFLKRQGFTIIDRNVARKTGELDIIARKGSTLLFIEVKSLLRMEFPDLDDARDDYDPSDNLHPYKIRKVARTAEWYVAEKEWEGD